MRLKALAADTALHFHDDEYYTRYQDIAKEMPRIHRALKGKTILLPCDTDKSAFAKYFTDNYDNIGLSGLIIESGDFKTSIYQHCVKNDHADVVITNPPFSKKTDILLAIEYARVKFAIILPIILNISITTYQVSNEHAWSSGTTIRNFDRPDGSQLGVGCCWWNNFPEMKTEKTAPKYKRRNPIRKFQSLSDKLGINVCKDSSEIQFDSNEIQAVPTTYVYKYQLPTHDIIGFCNFHSYKYGDGNLPFGRFAIVRKDAFYDRMITKDVSIYHEKYKHLSSNKFDYFQSIVNRIENVFEEYTGGLFV
jgi:hypothetical protein